MVGRDNCRALGSEGVTPHTHVWRWGAQRVSKPGGVGSTPTMCAMDKLACSELDCLLCFGRECHNVVGIMREGGKCLNKITWGSNPTLQSTRDYDRGWDELRAKWEYTPGPCHYLIHGVPVGETHFLAVLARAQDRLEASEKA